MASSNPTPRLLTRSPSERLLAGVCGGLAEHLRVPVLAVRIGMLLALLAGGAGGILYLWLWATVPLAEQDTRVAPMRSALTRGTLWPGAAGVQLPSAPHPPKRQAPSAHEKQDWPASTPQVDPEAASRAVMSAATEHVSPRAQHAEMHPQVAGAPARPADPTRQRTRWPVAELLFGTCLLVVGVLLVVQRFGIELRLSIILPGLAVLVGVGLTWWQIADRNRPESNPVPRVLGALSLVAVGVLMFFVTAESPSVWTVIAAALAALAGVALAIAPWLLRLNRELIAERAGREREAERSEIAAHLHDSVLQTLALIQQRSAPGSEVARIARGQERELREWLFRAADGGVTAPKETALEELRAHSAALEDAHPVRFEIVGVGAEVVVPEPIVAAAREAMLNAAQHAGGDVTVYAEVSPARVSIDVTDRGPGLDPDRLPEGRMGVRDSIVGRMARAGGTAKIVPGPGGSGTSVRLEMPREQKTDAAGDAGTGVAS
ncbi:PspC domain-containing protein [Leucobacter sp. NPDC015123]|uniref:PspC domain-containing protein n=1 Tax=Leucobacter sp. NPDC015123 TaxID=3364129 RepID=UPI0036F46605